jgi:hypothetical protein
MPIDPNDVPVGRLDLYASALEGRGCLSCACYVKGEECAINECLSTERKDGYSVIFKKKPQPTETKPMEDEYEISTADTAEEAKKVIDWIFSGRRVEVQFPTYWQPVIHVTCGALMTYRVKKNKTKRGI